MSPAASFPAWQPERSPHTWERHLVWLVPVAALVAAVAGLAWWGRDLARPGAGAVAAPGRHGDPAVLERSRGAADSSAPGHRSGTTERAATAEPSTAAAVYSRNIPVSSNEDLLEIIAAAPRRSVIVLSDDGPYQLGGRAWSFARRRRWPIPT